MPLLPAGLNGGWVRLCFLVVLASMTENPDDEDEDGHAEDDLREFEEQHDKADAEKAKGVQDRSYQSVLGIGFDHGDDENEQPSVHKHGGADPDARQQNRPYHVWFPPSSLVVGASGVEHFPGHL